MYKYIKNKDIQYSLWDACINSSSNGIIYALSWYLDVVAPGWDAIIKEEENKYVAVFPVTHFKKWGIKYLKQPHFSQQLGLFNLPNNQSTKNDLDRIIEKIDKKYDLVSGYNLNVYNGNIEPIPGFQVECFFTYHLDLSGSYDEIYNKYNKKKRSKINYARRLNLKINPSGNIDGLIDMFNKNTAYKIQGVKDNWDIYQTLKKLYEEASSRKMVTLYEVKKGDEVVAMSLFFQYKNEIIYFFSTVTPQGKEDKAVIFLLDRIINKYSKSGFILDFEGSNVPEIAEFYRTFGAAKKEFCSISKDSLPFYIQIVKKARMLLHNK